MSEFQRGDIVLCVDNTPIDANNWYNYCLEWITPGQLYTVEEALTENQSIVLVEVKSDHLLGGYNDRHFIRLYNVLETVRKTIRDTIDVGV